MPATLLEPGLWNTRYNICYLFKVSDHLHKNIDQILTVSSSRGLPLCVEMGLLFVWSCRGHPSSSAALSLNHPALGELPATVLCAWLFLSVKGKSKIRLVLSHFIQEDANHNFDAYKMNEWETWINMGMPWERWVRSKSLVSNSYWLKGLIEASHSVGKKGTNTMWLGKSWMSVWGLNRGRPSAEENGMWPDQ